MRCYSFIHHVELFAELSKEDVELRLVLGEESLAFQLGSVGHEPICLAPLSRIEEDTLEVPVIGEVVLLGVGVDLIKEDFCDGRVCAEGSSNLSVGVLYDLEALLLELPGEAEGEDVEVGDDGAHKEVVAGLAVDPDAGDDGREAQKRDSIFSVGT